MAWRRGWNWTRLPERLRAEKEAVDVDDALAQPAADPDADDQELGSDPWEGAAFSVRLHGVGRKLAMVRLRKRHTTAPQPC